MLEVTGIPLGLVVSIDGGWISLGGEKERFGKGARIGDPAIWSRINQDTRHINIVHSLTKNHLIRNRGGGGSI